MIGASIATIFVAITIGFVILSVKLAQSESSATTLAASVEQVTKDLELCRKRGTALSNEIESLTTLVNHCREQLGDAIVNELAAGKSIPFTELIRLANKLGTQELREKLGELDG